MCCNLGSLNLYEFVLEPFTSDARFDFAAFDEAIVTASNALDDIIDENAERLPDFLKPYKENAYNWRNIGLGVFNYAHALMALGYKYGSEGAIKFTDKLFGKMMHSAIVSNNTRGMIKGNYPNFNSEFYTSSQIFNTHCPVSSSDHLCFGCNARNATLLSIAPTGSIATMLGGSGGIEPEFRLSYIRKTDNLDESYKIDSKVVKDYYKVHGEDAPLPECFIVSADINWKDRIKTQAVIQKHIDTAISSTVNLPNDITLEDVEHLYLYAWEKGLKGVTIYRDGCKRGGILVTNKTQASKENEYTPSLPKRGEVMDIQDDKVIGLKKKLLSGCGSLHCAAYFDVETGDLREIYLSKGSTGGCVDADTEYFNGTEWKSISQYIIGSEEKVLQYNLNGTAELVLPNAYIENENVDSLYHFYNSYGMDMVLSEEHRMFTYKNYSKYKAGIRPNLTYEIMTVNEYIEREGSKERHIPTTFNYAGRGLPISNELIRLLVAIYADGTWDGHKIVISLKKERKKERLEKLLEEANIGYSKRDINNTEYTRYCLYPLPKEKQWFVDKQFTNKWLECTDEQAKVVIDECVYWDGSIPEGNRLGEYYSSKKEEVDILQFLLARLGYRGTISDNTSSFSVKPSYRLRWTKRNVHNLKYATIEKYPTKDGKSYCFNVPSGLLVLRRNNKIFVTGNCGNFMTGLSRMISMSARAGVKIHDIVDQLMSTGVCPSYATRTKTKHDTSKGSCCPMAIGYALQEMWEEFNGIKMNTTKTTTERKEIIQEKIKKEEAKNVLLCPDCGAPLTFEGGCNICKECGYSKCD